MDEDDAEEIIFLPSFSLSLSLLSETTGAEAMCVCSFHFKRTTISII